MTKLQRGPNVWRVLRQLSSPPGADLHKLQPANLLNLKLPGKSATDIRAPRRQAMLGAQLVDSPESSVHHGEVEGIGIKVSEPFGVVPMLFVHRVGIGSEELSLRLNRNFTVPELAGTSWTCKGLMVWVQLGSGPKACYFLENEELVSPSRVRKKTDSCRNFRNAHRPT